MDRKDLYVILSTLVSEDRTIQQAMSYGLKYSDSIMSFAEHLRSIEASPVDIKRYIDGLPVSYIEKMPMYTKARQ